MATVVGAACLVPGAAQAAPVDLLTGANARFDGAVAGDKIGSPASAAGDVNGDGRGDMIVSSSAQDPGGRTDAGSTYVLFGGASTSPVDLASTLTAAQGFRIDGGTAGDASGIAATGAGDVNGDGLDDVIVGAGLAGNNSRAASGSAYVIYGRSTSATINLGTLTTAQGFRIDGAVAGDHAGDGVSGAGDVNGDGFADVIVGADKSSLDGRTANGTVFVVYGSSNPGNRDLLGLTIGQGFRVDGAQDFDQLGVATDGAGDVNGDGFDDIVLGSPSAAFSTGGSAWVVFGAQTAGPLDLRALSPTRGFAVGGAPFQDKLGFSVAGAGDVNGDGFGDVVLGGPGTGATTYAIFGSASPAAVDVSTLTATQGFRIFGSPSDGVGQSVDFAGDLNRDGLADVIVGAMGADNRGRANQGSAFVIFGSESPVDVDVSTIDVFTGVRIDGAADADHAGAGVAGLGDVNGDGLPDLLVGAVDTGNNTRASSGSAYLVYTTFLPELAYKDTAAGQAGQALTIDPIRFQASGLRQVTVSPALPAGLALNSLTGRISGIPTIPGISHHRLTLTDARGSTTAPLEIAIVNAQGAPGTDGTDGTDGAQGPAGQNGTQGAAQTGAAGQNGGVGPAGPAGPAGAQGPAGRDGQITCTTRKVKKVTQVTCTVKFAKATKEHATLSRGKRVFARGSGKGSATVKLSSKHAIKPGKYTLMVSVTRGRRTTVTKSPVVVHG